MLMSFDQGPYNLHIFGPGCSFRLGRSYFRFIGLPPVIQSSLLPIRNEHQGPKKGKLYEPWAKLIKKELYRVYMGV